MIASDGEDIRPDVPGKKRQGLSGNVVLGALVVIVLGVIYFSLGAPKKPPGPSSIEIGKDTKAAMLTPTPGTVLMGPVHTFTWTSGTGVSTTFLWIGTTPGTANLVNFGGGAAHSFAATLPTTGNTIYVRLWSKVDSTMQFTDYTYTTGMGTKAAMISPTPGSVLGPLATVTWTAGTGVSTTYLWVGTAPGTASLVNFGGGAAHSLATALPSTSKTIYVRLWSIIGVSREFTDYTYNR
jgi:serine protease